MPNQCRITTRLNFLAIDSLRNSQNVSSVAAELGISASTVFRRIHDIRFPKPAILPQVLSIDEFKGNANGQKFQAILTDPKKRKIFDILPTRTQYQLKDYLNEFKNKKEVKYFIMDMNYVYREKTP